jgi:hypothetical protein
MFFEGGFLIKIYYPINFSIIKQRFDEDRLYRFKFATVQLMSFVHNLSWKRLPGNYPHWSKISVMFKSMCITHRVGEKIERRATFSRLVLCGNYMYN